jgi:hypothetical protein
MVKHVAEENRAQACLIVDHDRYSIVDPSPLNRGAWGQVYRGRDNDLKQDVALKVFDPTEIARAQMKHRDLSEEGAMLKEQAELVSAAYVVPRHMEKDKSGRWFVVMPLRNRSLQDLLQDEGNRQSISNGAISQERGYKILLESLSGLAEVFQNLGRAHGDIKPENVMLEERSGVYQVNDLGASTVVSNNGNVRDNMGSLYTRAPECFAPNSHPDERSDVFGWSALAYRIITGKYPLEDEINNAKDRAEFMSTLSGGAGDMIIKKKVNQNIPSELRRIIMSGLSFDPYQRPMNCEVAKRKLEDSLNYVGLLGALRKHAASLTKIATGAILGGALVGFGIYNGITRGPTEIRMPEIKLEGATIVGNPITDEVKFEQENVPYPAPRHVMGGNASYDVFKRETKSTQVAYLARAYFTALLNNPAWSRVENTEHQWQIYQAYCTMNPGVGSLPSASWDRDKVMIIKSIEDAIPRAMNPSGLVDLEDTLVISRLGPVKLDEARKAAGSFNYADYIHATDRYNKRIISKDDEEFIDIWRGYINEH